MKPRWTDRDPHTGQYVRGPACDCCGRSCGTAWETDEEVCGGTDGPGFYLCTRKSCRDGGRRSASPRSWPVEMRRAYYAEQRTRNAAAATRYALRET